MTHAPADGRQPDAERRHLLDGDLFEISVEDGDVGELSGFE